MGTTQLKPDTRDTDSTAMRRRILEFEFRFSEVEFLLELSAG